MLQHTLARFPARAIGAGLAAKARPGTGLAQECDLLQERLGIPAHLLQGLEQALHQRQVGVEADADGH
ncbi:hypothetical protein D9M69_647750 [compost metagenome]